MRVLNRYALNVEGVAEIERIVNKCVLARWSSDDIIAYCINTEYIDNVTDEDVCLVQMNAINKKYAVQSHPQT